MNKNEHLLACFAEELSETAQAIGKALRFGTEDGYPAGNTSNAQDIEKEFIEATAVRDMLRDEGVITEPDWAEEIYKQKQARVKEYMKYARALGTLA